MSPSLYIYIFFIYEVNICYHHHHHHHLTGNIPVLQYVSNFWSALPCIYWGSIHPYIIFQWRMGIESRLIKYTGIFYWKLFIADGVHFWGVIYWGTVLYEGLMIRSCHGQGIFTNASSSNLKTVNLKMCQSWRSIPLKINLWPVNKIVEIFILKVHC